MMDETKAIATRQEFGAIETTRGAELAAKAVAAQMQAAVQARYIMAMQRPRDWDQVRAVVLRRCEHPSFAEAAWYSKPVGGSKIEGLSIRFAEEAARSATNILCEVSAIYDDPWTRTVRVQVIDLENNITESRDVTIAKRVERRNAKGRTVLEERLNSSGQTVYVVQATDDEVHTRELALVSKAKRNALLTMIRPDIIEEAKAKIQKTRRDRAAKDPDATRKQLFDAFASLRIMPRDLWDYLGHSAEQASPDELVELRSLYQAVRDGETSWGAIMAERSEERAAAEEAATEAAQREAETESKRDAIKAARDRVTEPPKEPELLPPEPEEEGPAKTADFWREAQALVKSGVLKNKAEATQFLAEKFDEKNPSKLRPVDLKVAIAELRGYGEFLREVESKEGGAQ